MQKAYELFVAGRYLRSKRKEVFISIITVISILGVALSVMVLDIVLSVMTGFERELQSKLLGATAHVTVRRYGGDIERPKDLVEKISKVDGVLTAYPYTYQQAMISSSRGASGILVRGVSRHEEPVRKLREMLSDDDELEEMFAPSPVQIEQGDGTFRSVELPSLIIGKALAQKLSLARGSVITLFSPDMTASPQGLSPRFRRFQVVGIYQSGLVEYESGLAYTSIGASQKFFRLGEGVTGVEVKTIDLFRATEIGTNIFEQLGGLESPYFVTDWTQPNKALWEAIQLEKRVYFIVLLLLILVASFSVVSTLVMVVMEKGKDIAILKTIGASDSSILKIFFSQAVVIAVLGTVLGTVLGFLGCIALREYGFELDTRVFPVDRVPVHIEFVNFALVALASIIITSLAGVYPARRAARLRPAEALRYE